MCNEKQKFRILVCQQGARRRYAIPRMIEQAGVLAALYTDSSAYSVLGKCAIRLGSRAPKSIKRLMAREIRGIPSSKIYSSDAYNMYEFGQGLLGIGKKAFQLFRQRDRIMTRKMKKWGLQDANAVYSMYHENLDFIRWAKASGLHIVIDVFINPQFREVMVEEFLIFPDWGGNQSESDIQTEKEMWKEAAQLADILICPSEWVADGVRNLTPEAAEKIRIVPYGCSIDFNGCTNRPVPGRILFAGGGALRKGVHYLAQATTQLKETIPGIDVRIAGMFSPKVMNHPICKDLNFLGKLGPEQMKAEFLSADCFVLPSLSEGFAGVVAEAIGAGCPVVVSHECGSPIVDGREGIVVPSKNVQALADAIQRLVTDRGFRESCASTCLQQADFYSEAVWQKRLIPVIAECVGSGQREGRVNGTCR